MAVMANLVSDRLILHRLRVLRNVDRAPRITHVLWLALFPTLIKVNIDGAANGALGPGGFGGTFRTSFHVNTKTKLNLS